MTEVGPEPVSIVSVYAAIASAVGCITIPLGKVLLLRMKRYRSSAKGQREMSVKIEQWREQRRAKVLQRIAIEANRNKLNRG
jgi:hypothetical protein